MVEFEIYRSDPQISKQFDFALFVQGLFSDSAKALTLMKVRFQSSQPPMIKINVCFSSVKVELPGTLKPMTKIILLALHIAVFLTSFHIQPIR
jgi:hypothetical protein